MIKRKKASFTLLEIMVCIAVIALLSSVLGIQGADLIRYHRFRSSAQTFVEDLTHWRLLAMTHGCDISCKIDKNTHGYTVTWRPDAILPTQGRSLSHTLKGVETITVEGKPITYMEWNIFASGRLSFQGLLALIPKQNERSLYLDFLYPFSFQISKPPRLEKILPICPEKKKEHWS